MNIASGTCKSVNALAVKAEGALPEVSLIMQA